VQQWEGVPPPPFPSGFGFISQPPSRKLLHERSLSNHSPKSRFEAKFGLTKVAFRSACQAVAHANIVGQNLYKGHLGNITTWTECCAACQSRQGCVAWALRLDGNVHQKGCFLKSGSYKVIKNVRYAAYGLNPG
jgi:hypothetical protein